MTDPTIVTWDSPGHFCGADDCRWFLHHDVGPWCISTIGEYYPSSADGEMVPFGWPPMPYETMVFDRSQGDDAPKRWNETESRRWFTRGEAEAGHWTMVEEYKQLIEGRESTAHD